MSTFKNTEYIEVPTQNSLYNSTTTTTTFKKFNCIKYGLISSTAAIIMFMVVFGLSNSTFNSTFNSPFNSPSDSPSDSPFNVLIHSKDVFNSLDSNESEEDTTNLDEYISTIKTIQSDVENIENYQALKDVIIKNKTVIINGTNDSIVIY